MRIAVVTPYVASILGNRGAFVLARALARRHDVTVVADAVSANLVPEVEAMIRPARLEAVRTPALAPARMSRLLWMQIVRGIDRSISRRLLELHRRSPFDAVFVRSDEGHWIGQYVREWPVPNRPATLLGVLDLIDHPFLLRYERPNPLLRGMAAVAYPWLHRMEAQRLRAFDGLVTNSQWTTTLLGYLYGLPSLGEIDAYDDERFGDGPEDPTARPYIAVPTASLDAATIPWIARLSADGVPLRLFGPRSAGAVVSEGFIADDAMVELLRNARATLFLFDYEAFGLLPIESLALGTPVITQPKGGPYSELRTNPNVRFVPSYADALRACRELVSQPRTAGSAAACRASVDRYRSSVVSGILESVVDSLQRARTAGG